MKNTENPSTEQLEALKAWAALYGRNWKAPLRDAWMTGDYGSFEQSNYLQQIRNTFGPSWLIRFRLSEAETGRRTMIRTALEMKTLAQQRSEWVLRFLFEHQPRPLREMGAIPVEARNLGVHMGTIRGLEKRGLVHSPCSGLWYLTNEGKDFYEQKHD
jgi:hypothetical protein